MKATFRDYVRAAFSARPMGMLVPPNWIGVGAFALLGTLNPGFWLIGAGLELGYLGLLATNRRFQRTVAAARLADGARAWRARRDSVVARLGERDRRRYDALAARCRSIADLQAAGPALQPALDAERESLERLISTFLHLLLTRQAIEHVLTDAGQAGERPDELAARAATLRRRVLEPGVSDELGRSLESQAAILEERIERRREAREKLTFIEAELARIEQQVELVREQAALATDPETLSRRIDEIATTLDGTARWIRDQQEIFGTADLLVEPPPFAGQPMKESQ
jgi:hypothetical protein